LKVFAPGCVPEMNASRIAPGASDGSTEPLPWSTARKTIANAPCSAPPSDLRLSS
jgi:hypothetical protein